MIAIVIVWISVDHPAIRGRGAGARGVSSQPLQQSLRFPFGGFQGTAPLQAISVWTPSPIVHGESSFTDWTPFSIELKAILFSISWVERDGWDHIPIFDEDLIKGEIIVGGVEAAHLNRKLKVITGFMHGHQGEDRVMALSFAHLNSHRQFMVMLKGIGGQFVVAMAADESLPVRVITDSCGRIMESSGAVTAALAVTDHLAVRVSPGGKKGTITGDIEGVRGEEATLYGLGDKELIEDLLQDLLIPGEFIEVEVEVKVEVGVEVGIGLGLRVLGRDISADARSQAADDIRMVGTSVSVLGLGPGPDPAGFLKDTVSKGLFQLEEAIDEAVEGADGRDIIWGEAGECGVEGLGVQLIDPSVDGADIGGEHNEEGAEHVFRGIGCATLLRVGGFDDGAERGEIEKVEGIQQPIVMRGDRDGIMMEIVVAIFQILLMRAEFRKHRDHLCGFSYFSPEVGVKLKGGIRGSLY